MVCSECGDNPKKKCDTCGMTPKVVEIVNPEGCPILFHKISVPASLGDDTGDYAPENGKYKNILVEYEANKHIYIYSSDGIYTRLDSPTTDFNDLLNLPLYAGKPMTSDTSIPDVLPIKEKADSAVQPDDIDYNVVTSVETDANPSTTVVNLRGGKVNLKTGTTSSYETPLPVASTERAGVLNTATYSAIQDNAERIDTILGGAVALTGISADPTQSELTTAWTTATGSSDLVNGASILDTDNNKKWEYYTNDTTWHEVSTGGSISVNIATNSTPGIVKGSTDPGQAYVESNGSLSVNGWDDTQSAIANNTTAITTKQDSLVSGVNIATVNGRSLLGGDNFNTASDGIGAVWNNHTGEPIVSSNSSRNLVSLSFVAPASGTVRFYAFVPGRVDVNDWYIYYRIDSKPAKIMALSANAGAHTRGIWIPNSGEVIVNELEPGEHTVVFSANSNGGTWSIAPYSNCVFSATPLPFSQVRGGTVLYR